MDAAYKKYTIAQSVKLNFIEKCSNMKVKHPKDYWLEYERKMLEVHRLVLVLQQVQVQVQVPFSYWSS